jgi:hypothetical protein
VDKVWKKAKSKNARMQKRQGKTSNSMTGTCT